MRRITILTGLIVMAALAAVACGESDDGGEQVEAEAAAQADSVVPADAGVAETVQAETEEPPTVTPADVDEGESPGEGAAEPEAPSVTEPDAEAERGAPAVEDEEDAAPTVTVPRPYIYQAGIGVGFDLPFIERLDFESVPAQARGPVPGTGNPAFIRIGLVDGVEGSAPIVFSPLDPQIHIYPVTDYAELFEGVEPEIERLRAVLASVADGAESSVAGGLPFLPPIAGEQVFAAQLAVLDFVGGSGIRYLTQYDAGPHSITNQTVFYTFQGLTDDGAFYVAAFLPIRTSALLDSPATDISFNEIIGGEFPAYVEDIARRIDGLSATDFELRVTFLDDMIKNMEVMPDLAQLRAVSPGPTEDPSGITVRVFFSKAGAGEFPWDVFPVARVSPTSAAAQFAADAVIAGPTAAEQRDGYHSAWNREAFSADSDCGDQDYTLAIEDSTATIQFCRRVLLGGVVTDSQMHAQLTATLMQFATVDRVAILNRDGHCMFELSDEDRCLQDRPEGS